MQIINDMLMEGYELKEVCINDVVYSGMIIRDISITNSYIYLEFTYSEMLFAPLKSVDYVILKEDMSE